jgi:hypothetical protein
MSAFGWVLIGIAIVLGLLILGGLAANARRLRAERRALLERLTAADEALAAARAADRGWDRESMEAAARAAFAARSSANVRELQLIQVDDRPGIEDDHAVFRVLTDHGAEELRLGRRGEEWIEA